MLSQHDRRDLTCIESRLAVSDPHRGRHFAQLGHRARLPRTALNLPRQLLVTGLTLLVLRAFTGTAAVNDASIRLTMLAPDAAVRRPPAVTRIQVGRGRPWPGDG